jgi:hypothetical protein
MSLAQLPSSVDPSTTQEPEGAGGLPVSRRNLLALAGAVGAALALPVGVQRLAEAGQPDLVASRFTPLVGRSFTFDLADGAVPLVLVAVEGLGAAPPTEHAFTLRFTGPVARRQGGEVGMLRGPGVSAHLLVVPSSLPSAPEQVWVATIDGRPS